MCNVHLNPPSNCDICSTTFSDLFFDARTTSGPWANLCKQCFARHGVGLGIGRGQAYKLNPETAQFVKQPGTAWEGM